MDFLFSLHRVSEQLCDAPFFDTTQWWLDSESWFGTITNGDVSSVSEFLVTNPSYTHLIDRFSGQTAAHFAADKMNVEILKLLAKYEANFLAVDRSGFTPLHQIFRGAWTEETVKELLPVLEGLKKGGEGRGGVTFNEQSDQGKAPLHCVLEREGSPLFSFLLSCEGVNLNVQDCEGVTPLMFALREKRLKEAWKLVEGGGDLFVKTHRGDTTLSAVRELGNEDLYQVVFQHFESRRITQVHFSFFFIFSFFSFLLSLPLTFPSSLFRPKTSFKKSSTQNKPMQPKSLFLFLSIKQKWLLIFLFPIGH